MCKDIMEKTVVAWFFFQLYLHLYIYTFTYCVAYISGLDILMLKRAHNSWYDMCHKLVYVTLGTLPNFPLFRFAKKKIGNKINLMTETY